ncbi:YaeQ family protein [Pseudoalteromonas fenneropenaei]|uniref:YaeQ family protein n=1 Tax=Pseudoalteromonas fenneropenaei TaxID=1737459 RepID=A0ABV7CNU5_9GAMM
MTQPFVCKARINVADLFHQVYHLESFTTAVGRHESLQHFVLKLLGFCALSYAPFTHWQKDPDHGVMDVWTEDEHGEVQVALFAGSISLVEIARHVRFYPKVAVLVVEDEKWFAELAPHLIAFNNVTIFAVQADFIEHIVENLTASLHWDMVIDNGQVAVTDKNSYFESTLTKLL